MAEIFLAKTQGAENVSKFIAIKRILPEFSRNQEFIRMFKEEAKIAIHLSHSNVVSIFEFAEEKGRFYLSMEFVQGHNLRKILNRINKSQEFLSIDQIVYIINEISRGLSYAHRCVSGTTGNPLNIIHRDMSPQNIMVNYEGEVKIVDFGIAKAESKIENTIAGTLKGKFGYMSPEQVDGFKVDNRTDIFSLGIVLWELLSGKRLFISNNEVNTLRRIRECHIPRLQSLNPDIPSELERITNKALTRDRSLRYQSADELHRDLNKFLNRQYPDFTVHDFSKFIKTLFAKERENIRKKLIKYGKIQLPLTKETTTFIKEGTHTLSFEHSKTEKKNSSQRHSEMLSNADLTNSNLEVEMPKDKNNNPGKYGNPVSSQSNPDQVRYDDSQFMMTHSQYNTGSKFTHGIIAIIFIVLIAVGAYYIGISPDSKHIQEKIVNFALKTHDDSIEKASLTSGKKESSSEPKIMNRVHYSVNSKPSGAKVFINDAEIQPPTFTPDKILIEANKKIKITLKKRGYKNYTKIVYVTKDAEKLEAILNKIPAVGFLTVKVEPNDADIYINEKKVSESPPLIQYQVPANKKIKVTARNDSLGTIAQKIVTIKEDKVKIVTLWPKKYKIKRNKREKTRGTSSTPKKLK